MRAYLIDPENRTITEVDYSGNYHHIHQLTGCTCFDLVSINAAGDGLYVDDEGLFKDPQHLFMLSGPDFVEPAMLAGKALMLGSDGDGTSTPPSIPLQQLKDMVSWVWVL